MDPNDTQNNQPLPADYLDQISAKSTIVNTRGVAGLGKPIIYGGIAVIVLLLVMIIAGSVISSEKSKGIAKPAEQLAARLAATKAVVTDASGKIKDSLLRKINADLSNILSDTIREIVTPLAEEQLSMDKISKPMQEAESNKTMLALLEDSRLNGTYDNDYAREMSYKLETIMNLMKEIYQNKTTRSQGLKKFLEASYTNFEPVQKEFAEFNATTS